MAKKTMALEVDFSLFTTRSYLQSEDCCRSCCRPFRPRFFKDEHESEERNDPG